MVVSCGLIRRSFSKAIGWKNPKSTPMMLSAPTETGTASLKGKLCTRVLSGFRPLT